VVSHFSYWNCDVPYPLATVKATFKDQSNNPLANQSVYIVVEEYPTFNVGGITDENGVIQGVVPANSNLSMQVYNLCGTKIYSQQLGLLTSDKDLGVISIAGSSSKTSLTISGTATTCYGDPLINGVVNFRIDGFNYRSDITNGNYSITVYRCENIPTTLQIAAIDFTKSEQGEKSISVTDGTVNAGQIVACGTSIVEFASYTLNGVRYSMEKPEDSIIISYTQGTNITIYAIPKTGNNYLALNFNATDKGSMPLNWAYIGHNNSTYLPVSPLNVTITEMGGLGTGYIAGYFSGKFKDSLSTITPFPVTCQFKIFRN
jgi:hypothetical protein